VKTREAKRDKVADFIPLQEVDQGSSTGDVLVLGWGSTYGSIRTAVGQLRKEGLDISHAHLNYISPFPRNLEELLRGFDRVIVPEINNGQLVRLIRDAFLIPAQPVNKIKGRPFGVQELKDAILAVTPGKQEAAES